MERTENVEEVAVEERKETLSEKDLLQKGNKKKQFYLIDETNDIKYRGPFYRFIFVYAVWS